MFAITPSGGSFTIRILGGGLAVLIVLAAILAWRRRRRLAALVGACAVGVAALWLGLYAVRPRWLAAALADPDAAADLGAIAWTARAPGLETAELAIALHGEPVDSIALVRLDPARFALSVHWDREATRTADDWRRDLGAVVVINGSYFEPDGTPSTPLRIDHQALGPADYVSSHGALVIGDRVDVLDLRGREVAAALAPYRDAMVSYPLLVADGATRAAGHADWFANRSFIGLDRSGRIVLGTTRTGFCSLPRLGELLLHARLELRVALNLDGGPIASQVVDTGAWRRAVHGDAEITGGGDLLRLRYQAARSRPIGLPIVLAIRAR